MFVNKNVCLCKKHQNFALRLRALRALGIIVPQSPDQFCKNFTIYDAKEQLAMIDNAQIVKFQRWDLWEKQ